ncbi:MAG TPA: hypothetical protein VGI06_06110, partial [Acidimicrobiales bacterium]
AGAAAAPVAVSTMAALSVADDRPDPYPWAMIGAVAAAVMALAVALVLIFTSGHHSPVSAAARAGTSTPSPLVSAAPPTVPGTIVPIDTTSTSTSSTTVLPPAGRLGLNAVQVDLGDSATSAQVILTNSGQASSGWQASSGAAWLTVRPAAGVLASGGSITISLLADRGTAPAGALRVRVSFTPSGTNGTAASLEVLGTNAAPATSTTTTTPASAGPSITNVSANPSRLQASPCPGDQAQVSATVTDPLGVSSVSVSYTPPGGTAQTAAMTQSGDRWSTTITASSSTGTLSYVVTATDSSGVTTNSPPHSITVGACVL